MTEPSQPGPEPTRPESGWQPPAGGAEPHWSSTPSEAYTASGGPVPPGAIGDPVPEAVPPPVTPAEATPPPDFEQERRATRLVMLVCSALVLLVLLGGVVTLIVGHFRTDGGVNECKTLATSIKTGNGAPTSSGTFDEKAYHALRDPFNDSRYSDLRTAGTRLADEIWQLAGNGRQPTISDLGTLAQVEATYGDLVSACANHGVTLPPLPGG
ncbi:MAG TPA: hypothetical protein VGJ28_15200 [Micromonosporaceae bacterium]